MVVRIGFCFCFCSTCFVSSLSLSLSFADVIPNSFGYAFLRIASIVIFILYLKYNRTEKVCHACESQSFKIELDMSCHIHACDSFLPSMRPPSVRHNSLKAQRSMSG